ncbi:MAG: hypothetical protein AAGI91_04670 [Bacteroidota bacterium]
MIAAARVTAFASLGVLSATQDLVRTAMPSLTRAANPELVAEETLALIATVTTRAAEVGLQGTLAQAVGTALLETPFLYHDYLLGSRLVAEGSEGEVEVDQSVYERLGRKMEFYGVHFPVGQFPGPRALSDKLPLWMGRISPPKLPSTPSERLGDLGLDALVSTHLRLVLAFAQRVGAEGGTNGSG